MGFEPLTNGRHLFTYPLRVYEVYIQLGRVYDSHACSTRCQGRTERD